jgi:hypothetical protein
MKPTRREFATVLGATALLPGSLWARALVEMEQDGEVSTDLVLTLLDVQGERGIFEDPEHLEELRAGLTRKLRDHKVVRDFPIPDDIEPLLGFER